MGKKKSKKKKQTTPKPIEIHIKQIESFSFYPGSDNKTVVVTYSLANPEYAGYVTSYSIEWLVWPVGGNRHYVASTSSSSVDHATYDVPTNAINVIARVKVSGVSDTQKYTPGGAVAQSNGIDLYSNATTPSAPTVTIDKKNGVAKVENYTDSSPAKSTTLRIRVVRRSGTSVSEYKTGDVAVTNGLAALSFTAEPGYYYKAQAFAYGNSNTHTSNSPYGSYGSEVNSIPGKVTKAPTLKADKSQGDSFPVLVSWVGVGNADKYKVEYTKTQSHFDTDAEDVFSAETTGPTTSRHVTSNLTSGKWYFRVRAVNNQGEGDASDVSSIVIGSKPAAPTTWSYETVLKIGQKAELCWTHNSTDGSFMEQAKIMWKIGPNGTYQTQTVVIKASDGSTQTQDTDPTKIVSTYKWELDTTGFADSSVIYWKVATKGVVAEFSDYSTERQITVYEPPTLSVNVSDGSDELISAAEVTGSTLYNDYLVVSAFPLTIHTFSGPQTQTPIGLNYEITAEEDYEVLIEDGTEIYVAAGEIIYKRYATVTEHNVSLALNPGDVFFNNNTRYSVKVTVAMSNGLTAEATSKFLTHWSLGDCGLSAYITIDEDNLVAFVKPFAYDLSTNVKIEQGYFLSVYRREVNGTFDLIADRLDCADNATIVDVHPALDYARYRIVAINKNNGTVQFYDMPGEKVGETGIAIHWNENWRPIDEGTPDYSFVVDNNAEFQMGSLLVLPYSVDVSDDMGKEASLINYAGRVYPVSYYGTQRSLTSKWTVQIEKDDKETLNAIRRLAMYGGDSYVREPNGTGYWAALTLSYAINHNNPTITVNFNITRVEGEDRGVISESDQPIATESVVEEQEG